MLAFVGNGDSRNHDVTVTLGQGGKNAFPRGIDKFDFETSFVGHGAQHVDIKAFNLFLFVFKFKRCVGSIGAHHVFLDLRHRCSSRYRRGGFFFFAACRKHDRAHQRAQPARNVGKSSS